MCRFWECENEIWKDIDNSEIGGSNEADYDKYKVDIQSKLFSTNAIQCSFQPKDITLQLIENESAQKIDIMLGGGRASWLPQNDTKPKWDYDTYDWNCNRRDKRNLIKEWQNNTGGVYVENRDQLMALDMTEEKVLGIFSNSYVYWDHEVNETNNIPRLKDMAEQTVKFLQAKSDDNGYFVMIEAGRIDAAHHNGQATTALSETVAFDAAIEAVMALVDTDDTLVLVTADHAHTMSIGGYTSRFHDITGVIDDHNDFNDDAEDGQSMTILSYGNGPGFMEMKAKKAGNWTDIDRVPMDRSSKADYR